MLKNKTYSYKDVDMLLASKTIVESFKSNLAELSLARSSWNEEYVNNLSTKIDYAIEKHLGLDKKKELRNATVNLSSIQTPAIRDLAFLKKQLQIDFAGEKVKYREMLKDLGFEKNLRKVQNCDQKALIELLSTFSENMTVPLKKEIIEKGTNPELIDRIMNYADQIKQSSVSPETQREITKVISEKAKDTFNEIYNETASICKIASAFYQYDTLKKELFTFGKVLSNMSISRRALAQT